MFIACFIMEKKMINSSEVISKAIHMFAEQNVYTYKYVAPYPYCYLYGAKGKFISDIQTVIEIFKAEPEYFKRYSEIEKEQIIRNSIGRTAYDCSGFVGWACTGDKRYSTGQIENSHNVKTNQSGFISNPGGSILYTTYGGKGRHIGLDCDHGWCIDMAYESTDKNCDEGKAGIRLYRIIPDRFNMAWTPWEKSGMSNVVKY